MNYDALPWDDAGRGSIRPPRKPEVSLKTDKRWIKKREFRPVKNNTELLLS